MIISVCLCICVHVCWCECVCVYGGERKRDTCNGYGAFRCVCKIRNSSFVHTGQMIFILILHIKFSCLYGLPYRVMKAATINEQQQHQ